MESLAAFLALGCLLLQFAGQRKWLGWLFGATLIFTAIVFCQHATDALKLNF